MKQGGSRSRSNGSRLFSFSAVRRQTTALWITTTGTVIRNESASPRSCCPPLFHISLLEFTFPETGAGGRSENHLFSYTLFLLEKQAENTPNVCRFRSGNRADPFLNSPLFDELHQVCGLTLQNITNLIQCLYWKMLD